MPLSGKELVFSGTMSLKRSDATTLAEGAGASVKSAITSKTEILVAGVGAGQKIKQAQSKGIEVWTEDDFSNAVAASSQGSGARTRKRTAPAPAAKAAAPAKAAKAAAPAKVAPKKQKVGLGGLSAPAWAGGSGACSADDGVASTEAAGARVVTSDAPSGSPLSANLNHIDPSKNTDKYYVLQVLEAPTGAFYLYTRWGRTGTGGQSKLEGPHQEAEQAVQAFEKTYKAKTGRAWSARAVGGQALSGKYTHLNPSPQASADQTTTWEYFLTKDPMGKTDGWYPYDPSASVETEKLWACLEANPNTAMATRYVASESSGFTYKVDLRAGTQTNTSSGTSRPIRRVV